MAGDSERSCSRCGGAFRGATETLSVALPRSRVTASVAYPTRRCSRCGDVRAEDGERARAHLALCAELADAGVHNGEAMREMRRALDLRAADLAHLLGVTPETISHWETGKVAPNRAAFVALCAMVQDAMDGRTSTRDRLSTFGAARTWPRSLSVKLTPR